MPIDHGAEGLAKIVIFLVLVAAVGLGYLVYTIFVG